MQKSKEEQKESRPDEHKLLKLKIEEWLEAEGITSSDVPDFNSYFHLRANLKNTQIHLSEPKVRKGVLAVQGVVILEGGQLEAVQKIKPEDRKSLFLSMFSRLDKSEYLFMLQEDFTSKSWLRIQRTLYLEDLTRTGLLREMKDLNMKFVNVNYELNEALNYVVGPTTSEETTMYT